jgi:preprotein translocase subunit SecF
MLSTGSALDANILVFERLKEELRAGKQLRQAFDQAWTRAWPSIRDSNIAALITAGILYWFGSTFGATIVKGFSLTLAHRYRHQLVLFVVHHAHVTGAGLSVVQTPEPRTLGRHLGQERRLTMNILGKRYFFFGLSLIIIIPGLIVLFSGGLPLSIDFTGGSLLEVSFANQSPEPGEIIALYEGANIRDVQVQTTDIDSYIIRSEFLDNEARDTSYPRWKKISLSRPLYALTASAPALADR